MITRKTMGTAGRAALPLLVVVLCLTGGCEQKAPKPEPQAEAFKPPELDLSRLPKGLGARVAEVRAAIERMPNDPAPVGGLGAICLVHGFPSEAAICFTRAHQLAPEAPQWPYYLGMAYDRLEDSPKAIAAYQAAMALDSNYGPLYVRLADLLIESDRAQAEKLCQRALELNPRDVTAIYRLGLCAEAAGDNEAAMQRYEEALALTPAYREVREALATLLAKEGRTEEAAQHREAAARGVSVVIDDSMLQVLGCKYGWHLPTLLRTVAEMAQRGMFTEAEAGLARVAEADPTGVATHLATARLRADAEPLRRSRGRIHRGARG